MKIGITFNVRSGQPAWLGTSELDDELTAFAESRESFFSETCPQRSAVRPTRKKNSILPRRSWRWPRC